MTITRRHCLSVVPYGRNIKPEGENDGVMETKPVDKSREPPIEPVVMNPKPTSKVKYRDCMRNHAASIGGHANDGCGEYMPSAGGGETLTCAACGCHRNFHRKEVQGAGYVEHHPQHHLLHSPPMLLYNSAPTKKIGGFTTVVPSLTLPQPSPHLHHRIGGVLFGDVDPREHYNDVDRSYDRRSETPERDDVQVGPTTMSRNKRFRTKFTQEQKDRMLEFAEKLGWRIQKQDDVALNQFCSDLGIKRNVLKVWMHNNKSAHRLKECATTSPPSHSPPPPAPPQPIGV
ncbi:hypothetical protein F0562_028268 [Nyssa sinensis]|uniref:ZF-HD dimerization-type domain-containing protein n=1 Tax=Nyssa sinensis TaxID=561372 RepID=A0A5J5B871_9ASTE|nr:hypothetical protein F0562_028268 [Nyssa sinensis]